MDLLGLVLVPWVHLWNHRHREYSNQHWADASVAIRWKTIQKRYHHQRLWAWLYTTLYQHQHQIQERHVVTPNGLWGTNKRSHIRHCGLVQCNSWNGPRKIRLLCSQSVVRKGPPPNFQILVANEQLESQKSTKEMNFEINDLDFHEIIMVMENLTGPRIGLLFFQRNHTVLHMSQCILSFSVSSMQLKSADHRYSNVLEPILNPTEIFLPPNFRVLIRTNSLLYPENAVTGILQPLDLLHEAGNVTVCPALVKLTDCNVQIPVYNFTDNPSKLKNGVHFASVSVMTPERMNYVKLVDPVSTWHLLQNDEEQAAHYVNSLMRRNKNP